MPSVFWSMIGFTQRWRTVAHSQLSRPSGRILVYLILALGLVVCARWSEPSACTVIAQEFATEGSESESQGDDFWERAQPGLQAELKSDGAVLDQWIADSVRFVATDLAQRPAGDALAVTWTGYLQVLVPGDYVLSTYAAGSVSVDLAGKRHLTTQNADARWSHSEPVRLAFGMHPVQVSLTTIPSASPQIGLYWSGPRFGIEPISVRHLFHVPKVDAARSFERGAQLARLYRCQACHRTNEPVAQGAPAQVAPSLARASGNLHHQWIIHRLTREQRVEHAQEPSASDAGAAPAATAASSLPEAGTQMPHFAMSQADAEAIAAYLQSADLSPPESVSSDSSHESTLAEASVLEATVDAGRQLFVSMGCLACHELNGLGGSGPLGGGDLANVADKRPASFFERWLKDPASLNAHHRMPVFELSDEERTSLSAYLGTLKQSPREPAESKADPNSRETIERGAALVQEYRCNACHELPGKLGSGSAPSPMRSLTWPPTLKSLDGGSTACLSQADPKIRRPGYRLTEDEVAALGAYFAISTDSVVDHRSAGARLIETHNCLGCHARGLQPGIAQQLPALVAAESQLAPRAAALRPPAIDGVGDKLHDEALHLAVQGKAKRLRTWLDVRMPRFELTSEETAAIVSHLISEDRVPEGGRAIAGSAEAAQPDPIAHPDPIAQPDPISLSTAGRRLVTSDGFGCTSCHDVGKTETDQANLSARGTNLAELGQRIRRPWFDRWVRDPARIVPQMEMPAIQLPIRGVLHERLDDQLSAVWEILNEPGFEPPLPNPIRTVRATNQPNVNERAHVLTDLIEFRGQTYIQPFLIGLENRHNALFDFATNRLVGWWIGDTARQRTRKKSWYWESGGQDLFGLASPAVKVSDKPLDASELVVVDGDKVLEPKRQGQFVTQYEWFEHTAHGIRWENRVTFELTPARDTRETVRLVQSITSLRSSDQNARQGFQRRIEFQGLLPTAASWWLPVGRGDSSEWLIDPTNARVLLYDKDDIHRSIVLREPAQARFEKTAHGIGLKLAGANTAKSNGNADVHTVVVADYLCDLPMDQFVPTSVDSPFQVVESSTAVPGFAAARLPLDAAVMPTGLAWRPDGTLLVSSLKGQVFAATDTNDDQLPDHFQAIGDELACPYGLAPVDDHTLDVINKTGLLRLIDEDHDGIADRTEMLASGWSHTRDYHDWAVGLPRDGAGNYYVALPCQQDKRPDEAANYRGHVLQLVPREPTAADPQRYAIRSLAAGLRFPMGLLLWDDDQLFCTDNQGNYTPFNELNHIKTGRRYGFINRLENQPGFSPPYEVPAIAIPHPWTRSVNGICRLQTPQSVRESRGPIFREHEGHLIGCEYDTRRLVRMSLEKVAGEFQGAVYPFSNETADDGSVLEGPLVCQVSPRGEIHVGSIRDSGWGGGANTGSIVRLQVAGSLPVGIAEIHARPRGFVVRFAAPIERDLLAEPSGMSISSYRRVATPDYGGPDLDRRVEAISQWELSTDGRKLSIQFSALREGFVYEFRFGDVGTGGQALFPAEAYYTLNHAPAD